VTNAESTEDRLRGITDDIKRHLNEMHEQADRNRKEISQIYNTAREVLMEREQQLKRHISECLEKE
jgi:hypothetical protein